MKKSEIRILLVEDDVSLGKAIKEALSRDGFEVRWAQNADLALSSLRGTEYSVAIIDCMLPKMNGVELAKKIKVQLPEIHVIFTSGIFRDKSFSNDAVKAVNAAAFLSKPFDLNKLTAILSDIFSDVLETPKPALFELMSKNSISEQDIKTAFETTDAFHGFDLPWLFSALNQASVSGHLHLIQSEGDLSEVSFHNGDIIQVKTQDRTSFFGVLLVENGFTSPEEVQKSLQSQNGKPIGQTLVDAHSLSPHAIKIVHKQQMGIRLSQLIHDTSIEARFLEETTLPTDSAVNTEDVQLHSNDWIISKLKGEWLKSFYIQWLDNPLMIKLGRTQFEKFSDLACMTNYQKILKSIDERITLQDLLDLNELPEVEFYRCLHFMIINSLLFFDNERRHQMDFTKLTHRVQKIQADFEGLNHFEVLGISRKARSKEISRAYIELAKNLHPDRLSQEAPAKLVESTHRVFARIAEAYEILNNTESRKRYLKELELGVAEDVLRAESMMEDGRKMLTSGRYQQALELYSEIAQMKSYPDDVKIFLAWSKLKKGCHSKKFEDYLLDIKNDISEVPPEERHSAVYFFVKGLYYKTLNNPKKSLIHFKNALAFDPSFTEAKREMVSLKSNHKRGHTRTGSTDFGTVVTKIFRKKKTG